MPFSSNGMKDFKEIFEKSDWKGKNNFLHFGNGPEADWKLIVVSTITLAVLASALNVWMFVRINGGKAFEIEKGAEETEATLDLRKLRATLEYYQNKGVEFEKIRSGAVPAVVDPSI